METNIPSRLRAADADRERVAELVQSAGAEGRLSLEEIEDRLAAVYATKYTDELKALTADLPVPKAPGVRFRPFAHPALRVHAALAALLAVLFVVRWAVSDVPYFWPIAPMFWLAMSLVVHARIRGARLRRGALVA
ncbi:DUF1707 domain-containing protein [Amycolatopsis sp.]|jgi:hypothetical protein|uniref:DUF1707 SHOCT-like domain-containing protein n=1 Tax=Amycolatopsis sp. TaxID=37632 RepID=UPI002E08D6EE|nr:DUF1707 domain-containing protein [Amycolatopsis sp.]